MAKNEYTRAHNFVGWDNDSDSMEGQRTYLSESETANESKYKNVILTGLWNILGFICWITHSGCVGVWQN